MMSSNSAGRFFDFLRRGTCGAPSYRGENVFQNSVIALSDHEWLFSRQTMILSVLERHSSLDLGLTISMQMEVR
jgi:hypothetical protein